MVMFSEKMGSPFYRGGRRGGRRTVHNTNFFGKMAFFNNLLWENYRVDFHKKFGRQNLSMFR